MVFQRGDSIKCAINYVGAEATRVLKLSPAWTPGYQYGFPVYVTYMVPIGFTLEY
ncbi:hypothetical protein [Mucilaginibacter antarcticus]